MEKIYVILSASSSSDNLTDFVSGLYSEGIKDICVALPEGAESKIITNEFPDVMICRAKNSGIGELLKAGIRMVLEAGDADGCVTADCSGDYSAEDVHDCIKLCRDYPEALIMGSRTDGEKAGMAKAGRILLRYLCSINVSDVQTMLRGICLAQMEQLSVMKENNADFLTQMLVDCAKEREIIEFRISKSDSTRREGTFLGHTPKETFLVYSVFVKLFARYVLASMSATVIDLILYTIFCNFLDSMTDAYIILATVLARIVSSLYCFVINYKLVFKSKEKQSVTGVKYFAYVILIMCCSATFVTMFSHVFPGVNTTVIKLFVDLVLFFVNFVIQRTLIFKK